MPASQHHVGSRVLQVSTIRAVSRAPVMSTLIIGTTSRGYLSRERGSSLTVPRRNFWSGRNRSRHWATLLGAHHYHRHCKTRYDVTKEKSVKPPYRNSVLNWDHPLNQYRPSQGWRLSSSWGKPGGRWVKSDSMSEDKVKGKEQDPEWSREYERRKAEMALRLELFKKQIEKDPFEMLFGKAVERSINPWTSLNWLLASKSEKESVPSGEASTTSLPTDRVDAKPTTSTVRTNKTVEQTSTRDQQVRDTTKVQSIIDQHIQGFTEPKPSVATADNPIVVEDYDIDPITLRKVHRIHKKPQPLGAKARLDAAVDIPVKTFEGGMSRSFLLDRQDGTSFTAKGILIKPSSEIEPSTSSHVENNSTPTRTSGKTWLAQEGFGERSTAITREQARQRLDFRKTETSSPAKASTTKLETSLDRYLRDADDKAKPEQCGTNGKPLEYKAEENKAEDIGLLRASDVRASYGHVVKSGRETDAEKQARRREIEANYQEHRQILETQYTKELAEARELRANAEKLNAELGQRSTTQDLEASFLNEICDQEPSLARTESGPSRSLAQSPNSSYQRQMDARVQKEENSYARELEAVSTQIPPNKNDFMSNMKAQIVDAGVKYTRELKRDVDYAHQALLQVNHDLSSSLARARKHEAAEQALAEEVKVQKSVMAAIENRKTLDASDAASSVQALHRGEGDMSANVHEFGERDRWYKNKAPHAVRDQAKKLRDRDLIREIRGIYEDSYGTIDTKHRQVSESSAKKEPELAAAQLGKQYKNEPGPDNKGANVVQSPQEATSIPPSPNDAVAKADSKAQEKMEAVRKPLSSDLKLIRGLSESEAEYYKCKAEAQTPKDCEYKSREVLVKRWQAERQSRSKRMLDSRDTIQDVLEATKRGERKASEFLKTVGWVSDRAKALGQSNEAVPSPTSPEPTSTAPPASLHERPAPVPPTLYKVLAHDPLTGKVSIASTTSSAASSAEAPLSVSEALLRLSSPARFLPHFASLRQAGYEIVSGSGDVLVFKKVRDAGSAAIEKDAAVEDSIAPTGAAEGTATHNSTSSSPDPSVATPELVSISSPGQAFSPRSAPTPNPLPAPAHWPLANPANIVRRQEAVFSGSPRWRPRQKHDNGNGRPKSFRHRARRAAKRVLWVGAWTAGCCYAVGVAAEYFRTGGAGGGGPQGF